MALKDKKEQVEYILEKYPQTRSDDDLLILYVYGIFYGITKADSFSDIMRNRKARKYPSFETIRRCRQKITESNPKLRGTKDTEKARLNEQKKYLNLAREGA